MDPRSISDARVLPGSRQLKESTLGSKARQSYQKSAIVMRREQNLHEAINTYPEYQAEGLQGFNNQENIKQQLRWKMMNNARNISAQSNIKDVIRQTKVATIGFGLMGSYIIPYCIQLGFGIIYIIAVYTEAETLWGWVLPTETLTYVAWAVASLTSFAFMLIGFFTYTTSATNVYRGLSVLVFIIGCSGSLVPYFNIVPWLLIWILAIYSSQNSHSET